jgi:hypothetical protein
MFNTDPFQKAQEQLDEITKEPASPEKRLSWHLYGVSEDLRLLANQLNDGAGLEPTEMRNALRRLQAGYVMCAELAAQTGISEIKIRELLNNPHRMKGTVLP